MKISSTLAILLAAAGSASAFAPHRHGAAPRSSSLALFGKSKNTRGAGFGTPLDNISETVGNTPMVKISDRLCPAGRTIYAKAEYFNPLSSVKDRLALAIIEAAEADGTLKPGDTVFHAENQPHNMQTREKGVLAWVQWRGEMSVAPVLTDRLNGEL